MKDAADWSQSVNVSTAEQTFNLINASGASLTQASAHVEVTVDYSNYGAIEFTFMDDVAQGSSSFSVPLLNVTGIKEMNIFSQMYAPRRLSRSVAQIKANNNITLTIFSPGDIEGNDILPADISIALYKSNSSCDVPNPPSVCMIGSSANLNNFNPLSAVIGGGRLSFRMGTGGILVHYVNVDLLASGPPDAMFDDTPSSATSGNTFAQALRFGSQGPRIYDYVLVSIPYTETPGSGLDDSSPVNMSIGVFYDDDWNVIWNTTTNGTSGSALAGNYSCLLYTSPSPRD
mgnify:CR=1 FL=1